MPRGDLSPAEVVRRMVALQGQDLPAVLRAIAIRSRPGTTVDDVRAAFDSGELVRGWTQRGTLFATTPRDLAALMSLTAERVKHQGRKVREEEGIDDVVAAQATAVARDALADGAVSRATLMDLWQQEGVPTGGQRGYHLIVQLALDGLLHWGPFAGTQQLMVATRGAATAVRTPAAEGAQVAGPPGTPSTPDKELGRIARAYFATRGPATVDDLAWWLGLPKTPVRGAVTEVLAEHEPGGIRELHEVEVEGTPMLAAREQLGTEDGLGPGEPEALVSGTVVPDRAARHTDPARHRPSRAEVTLVPAFDEIVLGYQDRGLVASKEAMRTVVPFTNGVFRPAILLDGRLVGTWRRTPKKDEPPFTLLDGVRARDRKAIEKAIAAWEHD
ncbi:crosslink repair DNA glycosylase YcaQ family protein [Myceligenerans halotolerans]